METPLERSLRFVSRQLARTEAKFALIGGLAVSVHVEPRFTRDADLAVAVDDDAEAEALVSEFLRDGFQLAALVEQEGRGRLATARLTHPNHAGVVTDLLFASSGIEPEIVAAATEIAVTSTLRLPVAAIGHLITLKVLARDDRRRPTDADDLRGLAVVATDGDWDTAVASARLVVERGFHRGRDLPTLVTQLRQHGAY